MHDTHLLFQWLKESIDEKDEKIKIYEQRIDISNEEKQWLTKTCDKQIQTIKELEKEVSILRKQLASSQQEVIEATKDQQEFTKVSQLIHLEKENAKLRADIALLNDRISRKGEKPHSRPQSPIAAATPVPVPDDVSVYEKTIKGKTYYITDDDHMLIYDILEDGVMGPKLGQLVKQDNKTKVVWD